MQNFLGCRGFKREKFEIGSIWQQCRLCTEMDDELPLENLVLTSYVSYRGFYSSQPILSTSISDDVLHVSTYTLPEALDGHGGAVRDVEHAVRNVNRASGNVGNPRALE